MKTLILFFASLLSSTSVSPAATLKLAWDANSESDVAGYKLYVASTYSRSTSKNGDLGSKDISGRTSTTVSFTYDDIRTSVFFAVTAYNTGGLESEPALGYWLKGNLSGTFEQNVAYSSARVDGADLAVFGTRFGSSDNNPYSADLNKDGRVDGRDLLIFGTLFGNSLAGLNSHSASVLYENEWKLIQLFSVAETGGQRIGNIIVAERPPRTVSLFEEGEKVTVLPTLVAYFDQILGVNFLVLEVWDVENFNFTVEASLDLVSWEEVRETEAPLTWDAFVGDALQKECYFRLRSESVSQSSR